MTMADLTVEKGQALEIARLFVTERDETIAGDKHLYYERSARLAEHFKKDYLCWSANQQSFLPTLTNSIAIHCMPTASAAINWFFRFCDDSPSA